VRHCTACGTQLPDTAKFCHACGAPVASSETPALAVDPEGYGGFFGKRRRDNDFREHIENALADDILSETEERQLFAWAESQGVTQKEWNDKFRDLLDRLVIASVNDGRLPDVSSLDLPVMLKRGEVAHLAVNASLMKEVAQREMRGGGAGVSFRVAKGVRFSTGGFRARSVVVGTSLEEADAGALTVTSQRTVFAGQRKTLDLPHAKLVNLNVYTDGISFNMSNRQSVPLFGVPNGQVVAAIINAAVQRLDYR